MRSWGAGRRPGTSLFSRERLCLSLSIFVQCCGPLTGCVVFRLRPYPPGKEDPGPPGKFEGKKGPTYKTKAETNDKREVGWCIKLKPLKPVLKAPGCSA